MKATTSKQAQMKFEVGFSCTRHPSYTGENPPRAAGCLICREVRQLAQSKELFVDKAKSALSDLEVSLEADEVHSGARKVS